MGDDGRTAPRARAGLDRAGGAPERRANAAATRHWRRLVGTCGPGTALIAVAALYLFHAQRTLQGAARYDLVGEVGLPSALGIVLLLLGGGLVVQGAIRFRRRGATLSPRATSDHAPLRQVVAVCGLLALYGLSLSRIGFLLATPLFVYAMLWLVDYRNRTVSAVLAVGLTAALWLVFQKYLGVILPAGSLVGALSGW